MHVDDQVIPAAILVATGALLMFLVRRPSLGNLPHTRFTGWRTPATATTQEEAHRAHRAAAPHVRASGVLLALTGVAVLLAKPDSATATVVALLGAALATAFLLVGALRGQPAMRRG